MTERWVPVVGFEGLYEVSDQGRVMSVPRLDARGHARGGRLMATPKQKAGSRYHHVVLNRAGKSHTIMLQKVVLTAFAGPCPAGHEALHGDDDGSNNALSNLRWGTRQENIEDKHKNGRVLMGDAHPRRTQSSADVREIRALIAEGVTDYAIAKRRGISKGAVYAIRVGRTWSHLP